MTDPHATAGASAGALQFDTAEFADGAAPQLSCVGCGTPIQDLYHQANGQTICAGCRAQWEAKGGSLVLALALGAGAGLAGWFVYYLILRLTGYELAIIAILVGYMVGRGVSRGMGARGGIPAQILAVAITYVAITATYLPLIMAELAEKAGPAGASWVVGEVLALAFPFLTATSNPIGLLILGFGLWQAWKTNQRVEIAFTGPHFMTQASPAEAAIA